VAGAGGCVGLWVRERGGMEGESEDV
jgi:hypothetical protein